MGKGSDKLYITQSEWSSTDAFSASSGAGISRAKAASIDTRFKRLPYNYCAISLQPFHKPVCTVSGTIFDLENINAWIDKHGTNPVDGQPLDKASLIMLHFSKNDDDEYIDPVTFKRFTDNTHIIAVKTSGNAFAYETVERLNIKAKNWRDLVSDDEFSRKDIITLQDPQSVESRNLSSFKHIKDGIKTGNAPAATVNASALGASSASKFVKSKEANNSKSIVKNSTIAAPNTLTTDSTASKNTSASASATTGKKLAQKAAIYSTGKAAASFTSTAVTPHTGAERAILSDEEYMLKPKMVKNKGYATIKTNHGDLNIELYPEFAPKAVWNFIRLAQVGNYKDLIFHRNIKNFMLQGGDPTGTGRGGASIWGKNFNDEFEGPRKFDSRGVLAMANKGKNTNSSQFFITYRATKHLDRKHSIFGQVVDGLDVLNRLENVECDDQDHPIDPIELKNIIVFLDPFEEYLQQRIAKDEKAQKDEAIRKAGGTEDDRVTWTGKRIRQDGSIEDPKAKVGKYLSAALAEAKIQNGAIDNRVTNQLAEFDEPEESVKKKPRKGGFGNFDNW